MKRVLFVDDEKAILDGLQNLLRKHRREWDMTFAVGATEALGAIDQGAFDVVVSDMRMPGMDGAELLTRIREGHPGTARIVLSGHAELDAIVRALQVAHQFLSKPCDGKTLRVVIQRTCALNDFVSDDTIKRAVGRLDRLPSVPGNYQELTRALSRPDVNAADIAAIVRRDPGMTAKVLQLVNSPFLGTGQHVTSIEEAVTHLGLDLLKAALCVGAVATTQGADIATAALQDRSLRTAALCKQFLTDRKRAEEAFTAALVHEIGAFVVGDDDSHAEVSAYLLQLWGLPFTIVEAVAFHHRPGLVTEGPCDVLAALHVADALVDGHEIDEVFIERAGLSAELPRWKALAAAQATENKAA